MRAVTNKAIRRLIRSLYFFESFDRKRSFERKLRGREEARKLSHSDVVFVSFGKSGRTWFRMLISRYYQLVYELSEGSLMGFDNFHRRNALIPSVFFTHDNYLSDFTGNADSKSDFYEKRVILLVRSPQDVAISQYFQWKYRMPRAKKILNQYPEHGSDIDPFDFVMNPTCGLPKIIRFMNLWADESPRMKDLMVVRYEDMHTSPVETFRSVIEFLGELAEDQRLRSAVAYASAANMRNLEEMNVYWRSGGRMKPGKKGDPNSYKVRRAQVGGYRDYFSEREAEMMDELVDATLSPNFGFGQVPTAPVDPQSDSRPPRTRRSFPPPANSVSAEARYEMETR